MLHHVTYNPSEKILNVYFILELLLLYLPLCSRYSYWIYGAARKVLIRKPKLDVYIHIYLGF